MRLEVVDWSGFGLISGFRWYPNPKSSSSSSSWSGVVVEGIKGSLDGMGSIWREGWDGSDEDGSDEDGEGVMGGVGEWMVDGRVRGMMGSEGVLRMARMGVLEGWR